MSNFSALRNFCPAVSKGTKTRVLKEKKTVKDRKQIVKKAYKNDSVLNWFLKGILTP